MEQLEKLAEIFEYFHEAIYIVNKERKILYFNPAASEITGFSKGETVNTFCFDNKLNHVNDKGDNLCVKGCPLLESINENKTAEYFVYLQHKNGHRVRVHVRTIPHVIDNQVVGAIEVFTDVTEKNLLIEELIVLKKLNLLDPLTGLFNRRFLHEEFPQISSGFNKDEILGILFIDVDNFKQKNDTYGHLVGDEILKIIANTIQYNVRINDYVVRYGGDELLVLLRNIDQENVEHIAEKLRVLVKNSSTRELNQPVKTTISVGATLLSKNESLLQAINRADHAMYLAKSQGNNRVIFLNKEY